MSGDDTLPLDDEKTALPNQPQAMTEAVAPTVDPAPVANKGSVDSPEPPDDGVSTEAECTTSSDTSPRSSTPGLAPPVVATPTPTVFFLTNRMNLNAVLSSRLIAPREAHTKYYVDLLEQVPGWVPLLTRPPTRALIESVTTERGAGPPVLIEFAASVVKKAQLTAPVVYVPALTLSQAIAIHFREERDAREHRARGYNNIHPHDELLHVTPQLFEGDSSGRVALTPPGEGIQIDWQRVDRIRGAINGALASAQSGDQLATAAAYLGHVKFPSSISVPDWMTWTEIDDHNTVDERLAPNLGAPDQVCFRAAYEVLAEQDAADAWSPTAVLDSVESRIKRAGLEPDTVQTLISNLQRVRSIVNVEVDFEPFRPTARALISAKALLLVLLRPRLEQLLAWPEAETGADAMTRVTSAVLAGRLRGLARESTALRSVELDDLSAAWAVRVARGGNTSLGKVQFTSNTKGTALKLDGVELSAQDALPPDLVAKYKKVAASKKEAVRIAVSRAVGWPVTYRVTLPPRASTTEDEGALTILTPGVVELTASVDEGEFVSKIGTLVGDSRRKALAAFDLRKK